ncbi:MAG TPA: hypothetical protein VE909_00695 [Xanthobacteraceae bacterium]|nr:hypothetical protein [Xanthobacteraceae bacterium]
MSADNQKQWRIENVKHLRGVGFQYRRYTRWSESWDHDHCAGCWAKFAEFEGPEIQHEGYATDSDYKLGAAYEWVCQECFDDLRNDLQWSVSPEHPSGSGSPQGS